MCGIFFEYSERFNSFFDFCVYLVQETDNMNMTNGEGTRHLPGKIFKPASLEE
jgi:hypothetical protein